MSAIPERLAATGTDAAVSITRAVTMHRIGLRLDFHGRLDADRLARAVRLSLDAEPVLGCAFRTDAFKPYWLRMPNLDAAGCLSVAETADPTSAVNAFQAEEIDDAGPQVKVGLFRTPDADVLGIAISHVVADGQAAKQYAYLLADIYTRLGQDPAYAPEPNLTPRPSGRDVVEQLTAEQRREAKKAKSWVNPTWAIPAKGDSHQGLTYLTLGIEPETFSALKSYGNARGATVNDMMLTAVFRTCVRLFDPPTGVRHALMCTADLRRYLPNREQLPISNISISGSLDIERVDDETFHATLARVRASMDAWAKMCYGAWPSANAEKLTALGYRATKTLMGAVFKLAGGSGKTYPWFTNIGVIEDAKLSFGGSAPVAGHMFGPAAGVVPTVSTYRDTLTVCMGFCEEDFDRAVVQQVLDGIKAEIDDVVP